MSKHSEDTVDLRTLTFVETINANLVCCICQAPFVDPMVLPCGHTYCQACIYQACEASSMCPIDRSPATLEDIQPAVKIIANMVNELEVRCPRSDLGCPHICQRQFVVNHVQNDCLYTYAPCDLEECKELVLRKDLHNHISTCKYRKTECKMCKKSMRRFELEDHHRLCPAEIITCPHCETSRQRSEHTAHLLTCKRHPVKCSHSEFGCSWTGERQELDSHISSCPYEGIKGYLEQQRQREQALKDELSSVRKENETLKRQQAGMRQQIDTMTEQLAILFPSHFPSDIDLSDENHPPPESYLTETQRLKNEIETITANIASLELKQNVALMTETFRLQEELQSLRAVCHGIRMQMHFLMMERRGATSALNATEAASSSNAPSAEGSGPLSRMRFWLDGPSTRQETKL